MIGCGLRRSEIVSLRVENVQQRDGRWVLADVKGNRVRTVPVPSWVKVAIDVWVDAGVIREGRLLRAINKGGQVWGDSLTEKVIWSTIQEYAAEIGVPKLAPHDLRRYAVCRTMPNVSRLLHGVEEIQLAPSVQRGIVRRRSTGLSRRPAGHRLAYNGQASCRWAQFWRGSLL